MFFQLYLIQRSYYVKIVLWKICINCEKHFPTDKLSSEKSFLSAENLYMKTKRTQQINVDRFS